MSSERRPRRALKSETVVPMEGLSNRTLPPFARNNDIGKHKAVEEPRRDAGNGELERRAQADLGLQLCPDPVEGEEQEEKDQKYRDKIHGK